MPMLELRCLCWRPSGHPLNKDVDTTHGLTIPLSYDRGELACTLAPALGETRQLAAS